MARETVTPKPRAAVDDSGLPPPHVVTVEHDYKPVLYSANGKVLIRRAGF